MPALGTDQPPSYQPQQRNQETKCNQGCQTKSPPAPPPDFAGSNYALQLQGTTTLSLPPYGNFTLDATFYYNLNGPQALFRGNFSNLLAPLAGTVVAELAPASRAANHS